MTDRDFNRVMADAAAAAPQMARASGSSRESWLIAIADQLEAHSAELLQLAVEETHLTPDRLRGEIARTTSQLRLFADMIHDGGYLEATVDHRDATTTPPRPDLRRILVPLGPVAVYAASNFPFAFSVAGGDTAAALAVGCPVIVKIHDGHPRTSARTAELVDAAMSGAGAPRGAFATVQGFETGIALVEHSSIRAAAFTGSTAGGRALYDRAAARPDPIPFYGELGSINPVVITARAAAERGTELAQGLAGSFTMGSGQFCTKPGVVFVPNDGAFERAFVDAVDASASTPLLTESIAARFRSGLGELARDPDLAHIAGSLEQSGDASPVILSVDARHVRERPDELLEEHFGPLTLLVRYADADDLERTLALLPGTLTATVHAEPGEDITDLVAQLATRAGRVLFSGWPTGVAVSWAQHHGGPWPATTSIHTSVGMTGARRFQRPIAFQEAPEAVLPPELREANPLSIPRRVDGRLQL